MFGALFIGFRKTEVSDEGGKGLLPLPHAVVLDVRGLVETLSQNGSYLQSILPNRFPEAD